MADKVKEHKVPKINTIIVYPVTQNLLSGCLIGWAFQPTATPIGVD
ncbi:MAG: hypothetical protein IKH45_00235 [Neisseriaceae bacterium]|nr:hypothetical protein [Neisseriaceae bacterium]